MNTEIRDWEEKIRSEKRYRKNFRDRSSIIYDRWMDAKKVDNINLGTRYNILFANTEVMHGALYSGASKPSIRRRYLDNDPSARELAEMMERAVEYSNDIDNTSNKLHTAIDDYLVPGLGCARIRYDCTYHTGPRPKIPVVCLDVEDDGEEGYEPKRYIAQPEGLEPYDVMPNEVEVEDGEYQTYGEPEREKANETVSTEIISWDCVGWEPSKTWDDVTWIYFEHFLSKDEATLQFGAVKAADIPYGFDQKGANQKDNEEQATHAKVYEVWDKTKKKLFIFAENGSDYLKEAKDPLMLAKFFPMPEPLMANVSSKRLEPTANYVYYQDQAKELDVITARITHLTRALKVHGVYDGSFTALADLANSNDGQMIPIEDYDRLQERAGGFDNVFMIMPLNEIAQAIIALTNQRDTVKQTIYEITGISDVLRGTTKSSETLGAQQLKQANAGSRVGRKVNRVEEFIRDLYRLKIEIMVEHFDPKVLSEMTGVDVTPEMVETMKSDKMRSYKIAIETEATIAQDAALEQKNRVDVLGAITQLLTGLMPFVQAQLLPQEAIKELLLFGIRGFKGGRQLESMLEGLGQNDQPQQEPSGLQPGPEVPGMGEPDLGQGIPPELMQQLSGGPQQ